jgi:spermidine synthase
MPEKPNVVDIVPPGEHGKAKIEHFEVSREESARTRMMGQIRMSPYEYVPPGRYCRLIVGDDLMMSDTPMEWQTNQALIRQAHGDVLIAGLGIGMVLGPVLAKDDVDTVTVLEASDDVIALVAPYYKHPKLTIRHADAFKWRTRRYFDAMYFDIWPSISDENLGDMEKLFHRYDKNLARGGWMDAWERRACIRRFGRW